MNKHDTLSTAEYGLLSNKSTFDAISDVTDFINKELCKENKYLGVFLDLIKAFDTIVSLQIGKRYKRESAKII